MYDVFKIAGKIKIFCFMCDLCTWNFFKKRSSILLPINNIISLAAVSEYWAVGKDINFIAQYLLIAVIA